MVDITKIPPLDWQTPIVDPPTGFPSNQFIRLWQQTFQNSEDINGGLEGKADKTTQIIAGAGLTGGGDLSADRTLAVGAGTGITVLADSVKLTDTAVTPGTYGDATHVPQLTVDQQGRLTGVSNVTISGGGSGVTRPTFVQVGTVIGNAFTVTMGVTPTPGNFLVAMCSHWNNLGSAGAGWSLIQNQDGSSTDGVALAVKVVNSSDTTTQIPFIGGTGGSSVVIYEVASALASLPLNVVIVKEDATTPFAVNITGTRNSSLFLGGVFRGGSNTAFTVPTYTTDADVTGTASNNSPRRTQAIRLNSDKGTSGNFSFAFTGGNFAIGLVEILGG